MEGFPENNLIDDSEETVKSSWDRLENDILLAEEVSEQKKRLQVQKTAEKMEQEQHKSSTETETDKEEFKTKNDDPSDWNVIKVSANINICLCGILENYFHITSVPEDVKNNFSDAWARVFVKRFPDIEFPEWVKQYKDEFIALGATFLLFLAIREQKKLIIEQRKLERERNAAENQDHQGQPESGVKNGNA